METFATTTNSANGNSQVIPLSTMVTVSSSSTSTLDASNLPPPPPLIPISEVLQVSKSLAKVYKPPFYSLFKPK